MHFAAGACNAASYAELIGTALTHDCAHGMRPRRRCVSVCAQEYLSALHCECVDDDLERMERFGLVDDCAVSPTMCFEKHQGMKKASFASLPIYQTLVSGFCITKARTVHQHLQSVMR
jgi:hypothetical protein